MTSQNQQILDYLKTGKTITALEALEKFNCFRLAGRIYELKDKGWPIQCSREPVISGKIIGVYSLHMDKTWWPEE